MTKEVLTKLGQSVNILLMDGSTFLILTEHHIISEMACKALKQAISQLGLTKILFTVQTIYSPQPEVITY